MGGPKGDGGAWIAPDARGASGPDRHFDLEKLVLDLDLLPAERAVQGTATFHLRRLADGPLQLDQVALQVSSVTGPDGALPWRITGDLLVIDLPADFAADSTQAVTVAYRAEPRTGLHFREGSKRGPDAWSEVWSQGEGEDNRHWFPGYDHPDDRFVYFGDIRAPEGWKVLTNSGVEVVNYLVMVAAGPWEIVEAPGAPEIQAWVPPGTDPTAVERVLGPVPDMMIHMSQRTGVSYPWPTYRQVFVQRFLYTGMENTTATVEHQRMLIDSRSDGSVRWIESVVAHELAHQWYGDLLTCAGWRELWLNEGFATFVAGDWMRHREGELAHADQVRGWMRRVRGSERPLAGRFFHGEGAAANHGVYVKGASVLHMLQVMLGPDRFWAAVADYTQRHQHQLVETIDLQRAFERTTGMQLDWFFQQWVDLGHIPELTVTRRWSEGRLVVTVRQALGEENPRYTLPVTIAVGAADGSIVQRTGWLDDEELSFEVELDAAPAWVAFDPELGILAQVDDQQEPDAWAAQLDAPFPHARLAAIEALGETDRSDELVALVADSQADPTLREAAARALGAQRVSAPLLDLLDDPDPALRIAAAEALGGALDDSPIPALQRRVQRDRDPNVRAAAMTAIAALDPRPGLEAARGMLSLRDREEWPLRAAALELIGAHGSVSDIGMLLDARAPDRLRLRGLTAAARIVGRLDGAARTRQAERVARFAETMLQDVDLRTRQHVVGVLAEVGDERSVARLEAYRRWTTLDGEQQAARDAVRSIRSRKDPVPGGQNEAEARIRELEERLDELAHELEQLHQRR